jgi:hypothetical protein
MKAIACGVCVSALLLFGVGCGSSASSTANFTVLSSASAAASRMDLRGGTAGSKATSVKVKISGAWISANADCSSPIALEKPAGLTEDANGYVDMAQGFTILQGNIPAGTYNCLVLKLVDVVKFTPSSSGTQVSGCTAGTEYSMDVYSTNGATGNINFETGDTIAPADSLTTAQPFYFFVSTGITLDGNSNPTNPTSINVTTPAGATIHPSQFQCNKLTGALTVPGSVTYNLDPTNQIYIENSGGAFNGDCWLEKPVMGFR